VVGQGVRQQLFNGVADFSDVLFSFQVVSVGLGHVGSSSLERLFNVLLEKLIFEGLAEHEFVQLLRKRAFRGIGNAIMFKVVSRSV
jgi:hypothetical protein